MNNKYELIPIEEESRSQYYRIRALKDFGNVKAGEVGGIVKDKFTLGQKGDCWIDYYATITGDLRVADNAYIGRGSHILGKGSVTGNVVIKNFILTGELLASGNASINGKGIENSLVTCEGVLIIGDNAKIDGRIILPDHLDVSKNVELQSGKDCAAIMFGGYILTRGSYLNLHSIYHNKRDLKMSNFFLFKWWNYICIYKPKSIIYPFIVMIAMFLAIDLINLFIKF